MWMDRLKQGKKKAALLCLTLCLALSVSGCGLVGLQKEKEEEAKRQEEEEKEQEEREREAQEKAEKEKELEEEQERKAQAEKEAAEKAAEEAEDKGVTIVIDPGHSGVVAGGEEPVGPGAQEYKAADTSGTSGISTGIPEYELTLTLSVQLKAELEARGYTVVMTRENSDEPRSCVQRAEIMNNAGAAACVRVHANGSEDTSVQGAMTICNTPDNPYAPQLYQASRNLADCVLNGLVSTTGCISQGVWETDTMSGNNWSQIPVTIVEVGYMTNPEEDVRLSQPDYQAQIVQGIADGVDAFTE